MHMTVQFKPDGTAALEIDGVDISDAVRRDDFTIGFDDLQPVVHVALRPKTMIVDGEIQPHEEFTLALANATGDES